MKVLVFYASRQGLKAETVLRPDGQSSVGRIGSAWRAICKMYDRDPTFLAAFELEPGEDPQALIDQVLPLLKGKADAAAES